MIAKYVEEMGFRRKDVISCLELVGGDADAALELLMGINPDENREEDEDDQKSVAAESVTDLPDNQPVSEFASSTSLLSPSPTPHRLIAHFSLVKATIVLLPSKYGQTQLIFFAIFIHSKPPYFLLLTHF